MRWPIIVAALCLGSAWGQVCHDELTTVFSGSGSPDHVTGLEIASLFRRALELIEPGLPALTIGVSVDGEPGSPGYQDALFLAQRGLLPSSWDPEQLTLPVWQEMVRVFMDWYRLDPIVVRAPDRRNGGGSRPVSGPGSGGQGGEAGRADSRRPQRPRADLVSGGDLELVGLSQAPRGSPEPGTVDGSGD